VIVQTFDADYMTSKLLLKLQRDRELWQRICQLVQGIYRRVDAFEASDLLPDRRRHIIYHMPRSSSIHYCTAIANAAFNKLASYSKTLNLNQEIIPLHTHIRLFILLIAQLVLSCHSHSLVICSGTLQVGRRHGRRRSGVDQLYATHHPSDTPSSPLQQSSWQQQ